MSIDDSTASPTRKSASPSKVPSTPSKVAEINSKAVSESPLKVVSQLSSPHKKSPVANPKELDELEESEEELPDRLTTPPVFVKKEPLYDTDIHFQKDPRGQRISTPISISSDESDSDDVPNVGFEPGDEDMERHEAMEEDEEEEEETQKLTTPRPDGSPVDESPATKEEIAEQDLPPTPAHCLSRSSRPPPASQPATSTSRTQLSSSSSEAAKMTAVPVSSAPASTGSKDAAPAAIPPSQPTPAPKSRQIPKSAPPAEDKRRPALANDAPPSPLVPSPFPKLSQSTRKPANPLKNSFMKSVMASQGSPQLAFQAQPSLSQSSSSQSSPQSKPSSSSQVEAMLTTDDENNKRPPKRPRSPHPKMQTQSQTQTLSQDLSSSVSVSGPPKKRLKTHKHQEYWLLDGSVIIRIGRTDFCLHRSRLSALSPYFANLFSKDPTRTVDENGNKCLPIHEVNEVTVQDFERLLAALDGGIAYVYSPPPFPVLISILRASRALSFKALDDFASYTLKQMWPSELSKLTHDQSAHASATIVVARKCGLPEVLKRAFYELLRSPVLGQELSEDDYIRDEDEENSMISREDLLRLIYAREKLHLEWYLATDPSRSLVAPLPCPLMQLPPVDAPAPAHPEQLEPNPERDNCIAAHQQIIVHWHNQIKRTPWYEDCDYDPLYGLQRLIEIDWVKCGFCEGCVKAWRDAWKMQRESIWEKLDIWLRLGEAQQP